jgi:hypothetical protein
VGRIGKNIASIAAFILALAAIYGLWEYTGRLVEKPEKPPAVVRQEPSRGDVLYSDILPAGTPAGTKMEKPEKASVVALQEPASGGVLYSDILPARTNPEVAGKEGPADVQDAPAEAVPPEKEVAPVPPQAEPQQPAEFLPVSYSLKYEHMLCQVCFMLSMTKYSKDFLVYNSSIHLNYIAINSLGSH